MEKITFVDEDNEKIEFFVIEQTRINGMNYILVTEELSDEEAEAYILKDISEDDETDAVYEFLEDDQEILAIGKVFEELMEEIDLEL